MLGTAGKTGSVGLGALGRWARATCGCNAMWSARFDFVVMACNTSRPGIVSSLT